MVFERLNNGEPIIPDTGLSWEKEGMSNSAAMLLPASEENIKLLANIVGKELLAQYPYPAYVIATFTGNGTYRNDKVRREYRGLAILTPELTCIYKHSDPVIFPTPGTIDELGIEDARICRVGKRFYQWYCGYNGKTGSACAAYSDDLLNWTKAAPLQGSINQTMNKDHLIFDGPIDGKYYMLHRPWGDSFPNVDMGINLAVSDQVLGAYTDLGVIMKPRKLPGMKSCWLGAGPTPIRISGGKYLLLYHTGCFFEDGYRQYDACGAIIDFSRLDGGNLPALVTKRLEPIMVPQTEMEKNPDLRIDIIFPMGNYIYEGYYYLVYGAGDKMTCGARIPLHELLHTIEQDGTGNQ